MIAPSEGVKRLMACASAQEEGRLFKVLGCRSLDVTGKNPFNEAWGMQFNFRGSALKLLQSAHPHGPERYSSGKRDSFTPSETVQMIEKFC
jgi:hypothetical protein